ncbi:MAG TPA: hypothetical protein VGO85_14115 [Caldimonas sp.]|nr:hypothetical protein [Caldimonas sp.]
MKDAGDDGLVYACLTHVPLTLEFPSWIVPIHLGAAQHDGVLNLRDLAPAWDAHHPSLGSTAGAFALTSLVRARFPNAARVGICQYRKFISRQRISGVQDPRYRVMDVVPRNQLAGDRLAAALDPGDAMFLVSAPRRFTRVPWHRRGYLKEYARDHCVEDLLRFTGEAVDQGVIERREVTAFFGEDVIVPGGVELGVYPAPFWLESTAKIEGVVRACVAKHATVRDAYQARLWSFCAERLGSWLLLKRFRVEVAGGFGAGIESIDRRRWSKRFAGQLNLVTDSEAHAGYSAGA